MNDSTFSIRKTSLFVLLFLLIVIPGAVSDTIYLKNGRKMEGLVKKEAEDGIWLDLGFGSVKFKREEIERIDRSSPEGAGIIRQEWQREKDLEEKRWEEKSAGPKEVGFSEKGGNILINALLNDRINATLILDTGASMILLSRDMTKKLGIKTDGVKVETTGVGGIRDLRVVYTVLDSVKIEGVEARDVDIKASLDETPDDLKDGLLGMSFLRKFNFQIDSVNKKLILEKYKPQDILEKTKYFSVLVPSDWEVWKDGEDLSIRGPNLTVREGLTKPYITIRKYIKEDWISYMQAIKGYYDYLKDSPDLENKMTEWRKEGFKESDLQNKYRFISCDFETKRDLIVLHTVFIEKKGNTKCQETYLITTRKPVNGYVLWYNCPEEYFNEYIPVFKKCLDSFSAIE